MQGTGNVSRADFFELVEAVFESGTPVVYPVYSDYGQRVLQFLTPQEFSAHIEASFQTGLKFLNYAVHFRDAKGLVSKRTIFLNPQSCDGQTWRESVEGWGLVYIQPELTGVSGQEFRCRIAVNSEIRANAWTPSYPGMRNPDLWDWKIVEKHARRLIRRLKKFRSQSSALVEHSTIDRESPSA
jgi:hypothetical protein